MAALSAFSLAAREPRYLKMSSLFLSPNRDITTFLVPAQCTSFLWQKYFLSQLLPAHSHSFHHDFPKLLLLTERPRLGAQTRWAPHSVSGEETGTFWLCLGDLGNPPRVSLSVDCRGSWKPAGCWFVCLRWDRAVPLHGQDRTGHFRPSHPTEQHLNSLQEFNSSKKAAETRTHETDSKQGKTANNCPLLKFMLLFLHLHKESEDSQEHGKQRFPRDNLNAWCFSGFC